MSASFTLILLVAAVICNAQLYPYCKKGMWGYADSTGKLIVKPKYKSALPFMNGAAYAQDGNGEVIIDEKGKVLFDELERRKTEEKIKKKLGDRFKFFDIHYSGNIILWKDTTAFVNSESRNIGVFAMTDFKGNFIIKPQLAWVMERWAGGHIYAVTAKGKFLYSKDGYIVLKNIRNLRDAGNDNRYISTETGFHFLEALSGKIIPVKEDVFYSGYRLGENFFLFRQTKGDKSYVGICKEDIEIVPARYNEIKSYSDKLFVVIDSKNMYGVLDTNGKIVVPFEFNFIGKYSEELAPARKGDNCFYINGKGKTVVPAGEYSFSIPAYFSYTEKAGGKDIFSFHNNLAVAFKEGNAGFIDKNGKFVILPRYSFAQPFNNGLSCVYETIANSDSMNCSVINKDGISMFSFLFPHGTPFTNTYIPSARYMVQVKDLTLIKINVNEWIAFNSAGSKINGPKITEVIDPVLPGQNFLFVSTEKARGITLRSDGKLFFEE